MKFAEWNVVECFKILQEKAKEFPIEKILGRPISTVKPEDIRGFTRDTYDDFQKIYMGSEYQQLVITNPEWPKDFHLNICYGIFEDVASGAEDSNFLRLCRFSTNLPAGKSISTRYVETVWKAKTLFKVEMENQKFTLTKKDGKWPSKKQEKFFTELFEKAIAK